MVEQLKTYSNNLLALEIIDSFTEADEQYVQKLFENKKEAGFDSINLLLKLDKAKISKISFKVFLKTSFIRLETINT